MTKTPPSPNLPVTVAGASVALAVPPPPSGLVKVSIGPRGLPVLHFPRDPRLPWAGQVGLMAGVAAGWAAGFSVLWTLAPPGDWAFWVTRALLVAWTGGGSVLLARLMRLFRTRGRVELQLGPGSMVAHGTRPLAAVDDVVTRQDAATARLAVEDGTPVLQVDGPGGRSVTLARDLPAEDFEWLLQALHAYGRGEG